MSESKNYNPDLVGIFYSYFHNIEGPILAVQYPPEFIILFRLLSRCISLDTFNSLSDYIITKDNLSKQVVRICVADKEIIGFPIQIKSQHYVRNAFNFNLCFVVNKGKSAKYKAMVEKIASKLEWLEKEKEYLQKADAVV